MVVPETPEQVSLVITTISQNQCPFGIRGGGHGTHALSNSLEEGITIDMGMNPVKTKISDLVQWQIS